MGCKRIFLALLFTIVALPAAAQYITVTRTLPRAGYVTAVLEDTLGNTLLEVTSSEFRAAGPQSFTFLPYKKDRVFYDLYDKISTNQDSVKNAGLYTWVDSVLTPGQYLFRLVLRDSIYSTFEGDPTQTGNPPWHTLDGKGGGLADHNPPMGVACLDSPNVWSSTTPVCIVSSPQAEAGRNYMALLLPDEGAPNEDSLFHKVWEASASYGAAALAVDSANGNPAIVVYGAYIFSDNRINIFTIGSDKVHTRYIVPAATPHFTTNNRYSGDQRARYGLAVNNQRYVFAANDSLACIDANRSTVRKSSGSLMGLAWNGGALYATNEAGQLVRYSSFNHASCSLGSPTVLVSGLVDPVDLALVGDTLAVSQWGTQNNVKLYTRAGVLIRTLGLTGDLQLGAYNVQQMQRPAQVSFVGGKWIIAEASYTPKRVVCFNATNDAVVTDICEQYFIHGKYSPGGVLVSRDVFVYCAISGDCMEWPFVPGDTTATGDRSNRAPRAILFRTNTTYADYHVPLADRSIVIAADTFIIGCGAVTTEGCGSDIHWFLKDGPLLKPRGYIGTDWNAPSSSSASEDFNVVYDCLSENSISFWSDTDGDGHIDMTGGLADADANLSAGDEVACGVLGSVNGANSTISPIDGSFANSAGAFSPPPTIGASSEPIWNPASFLDVVAIPQPFENWAYIPNSNPFGIIIVAAQRPYLSTSQGDPIIGPGNSTASNRWLWTTRGPFYGFQGNVRKRIDVSGPYGDAPTLPPPSEGRVTEPQKAYGPVAVQGEDRTEYIWGVNTDKGAECLFTIDGISIGCLRRDARMAPSVNSNTDPGIWFGFTEKGEHWHGKLAQVGDTTFYTGGKEYSGVHVVHGLESITRVDSSRITITAGQISAARAFVGADTLYVDWNHFERDTCYATISNIAPRIDGLEEAPEESACTISDSRGTYGSVVISTDSIRFFVGIDTNEYPLQTPARSSWQESFADGGFMDLVLWDGVGSSVRFLMSETGSPPSNTPMGVRIIRDEAGRVVSPTSYLYESPLGTLSVEDVRQFTPNVVCISTGCEASFARSLFPGTISAGTIRFD
jgi:hypothetical protein